MSTTLEPRTLTVSIARDADAVYQFVSNPANLPQWAMAFCQSIRQVGSDWLMETNVSPMTVAASALTGKVTDPREYLGD